MTFEVRYKPNLSGAFTPQDGAFRALTIAARTKEVIPMMDLDRKITDTGAMGLVGNWNIAMSRAKPVEGVVTASVTANLTAFANTILAQDGTGTGFFLMDEDGDFVAQVLAPV